MRSYGLIVLLRHSSDLTLIGMHHAEALCYCNPLDKLESKLSLPTRLHIYEKAASLDSMCPLIMSLTRWCRATKPFVGSIAGKILEMTEIGVFHIILVQEIVNKRSNIN